MKLNAETYADAKAEYAELRSGVAKGARIAPASLRFEAVAREWLEGKSGRLGDWTLIEYTRVLDNEILPRFGHRKLRDITVDDIAKWVRVLEERGLSANTIANYLKPISGTYQFATRRGMVSVNPVTLLSRDERPKHEGNRKAYEWTTEEIASIFSAAERLASKPNAHADYSALLRTAVYAGLRLGELLGLRWQDVELDDGVIEVRHQWTKLGALTPPKTKAELRRVPISPQLATLLKAEKVSAFARGLTKPEDFVFPAKTGGPKMHRTVQRAWDRVREEAGLPEHLTFHD